MTTYQDLGRLTAQAAQVITKANQQQRAARQRTEINQIRARARAGRTTAQQHKHTILSAEKCPTAVPLTHWIPPGFDYCVRGCGATI